MLLGNASTSDRVIPTLLEHQTSWELGRVTQLVEVVQLALSLLHKLLTEPEAGASVMSGPVGHAVRSPPARSHFLLTWPPTVTSATGWSWPAIGLLYFVPNKGRVCTGTVITTKLSTSTKCPTKEK